MGHTAQTVAKHKAKAAAKSSDKEKAARDRARLSAKLATPSHIREIGEAIAPTPQQWVKLRARVVREEKYCRTCFEGHGSFQPGQPFRTEASKVSKIDPHKPIVRPNLKAVCDPCATRDGYLDPDDMGWIAGHDPEDPADVRVVHDARESTAVAAAAHRPITPGELSHSLLEPDPKGAPPGNNIVKLERRVEALRLRMCGCDYRTIVQELRTMGFEVSLQVVYEDVRSALTELAAQERELAEPILELELARLDAMFMALWTDIERGDFMVIQTALKIMERRAKYLGLDKPTKLDVAPAFASRKFKDLSDDQLNERASLIMERLATAGQMQAVEQEQPVIDVSPS